MVGCRDWYMYRSMNGQWLILYGFSMGFHVGTYTQWAKMDPTIRGSRNFPSCGDPPCCRLNRGDTVPGTSSRSIFTRSFLGRQKDNGSCDLG